jgi:quinolinate synthase
MPRTRQSITNEIAALRREQDAVILAHSYQMAEVQDVADVVAGTLGLLRAARDSSASVLVACCRFELARAVTALCPSKAVLYPAPLPVRAPLPAPETDPAEHDTARYDPRTISDRVHEAILATEVAPKKQRFPTATVLAHRGCLPEVRALANVVDDTDGLCAAAQKRPESTYLVVAGIGLLHRLQKSNPRAAFIPATLKPLAGDDKPLSLNNVVWALREHKTRIALSEQDARESRVALTALLDAP